MDRRVNDASGTLGSGPVWVMGKVGSEALRVGGARLAPFLWGIIKSRKNMGFEIRYT